MKSGLVQAAGLAAAMALAVVSHYPEEIFPRVLRAARSKEAAGSAAEALSDYHAVVSEFQQLDLDDVLDDGEPLDEAQRCASSASDASARTTRSAPRTSSRWCCSRSF